jgi:hypothetical protein
MWELLVPAIQCCTGSTANTKICPRSCKGPRVSNLAGRFANRWSYCWSHRCPPVLQRAGKLPLSGGPSCICCRTLLRRPNGHTSLLAEGHEPWAGDRAPMCSRAADIPPHNPEPADTMHNETRTWADGRAPIADVLQVCCCEHARQQDQSLSPFNPVVITIAWALLHIMPSPCR